MFWYVLVCFGMFWYVLVCFGMFWYVFIRRKTCQNVPKHDNADMFWYVLLWLGNISTWLGLESTVFEKPVFGAKGPAPSPCVGGLHTTGEAERPVSRSRHGRRPPRRAVRPERWGSLVRHRGLTTPARDPCVEDLPFVPNRAAGHDSCVLYRVQQI